MHRIIYFLCNSIDYFIIIDYIELLELAVSISNVNKLNFRDKIKYTYQTGLIYPADTQRNKIPNLIVIIY